MQKRAVLFVSLFLFAFFSATACLWIYNLRLKQSLKKDLNTKISKQEIDLQQHNKLKEDLKRDLEEKYRADMISYKVVAKRLEQEQNKENSLTGKQPGQGRPTRQ